MVGILSILALVGLLMQNMPSAQTELLGPFTLIPGFVLDKPFSGRFLQQRWRLGAVNEAPVLTVSGQIYRDSRGRERVETDIEEPSGDRIAFIGISDAVAGEIYALNPEAHTVVLERTGPAKAQTKPHLGPASAAEDNGNVSYEVVEGLRCRVYDGTPPGHIGVSHLKTWISEELERVVKEEVETSDFTSIWRLYDIHRGEPDSSLFKVPEGYTVIAGTPGQK